ncbi:MAG: glycerol-3-phosphate 1-O-acyltransferase PlsY [Armatimonadetes bacterium]|nr:glycerol-3-phosphate 1-O-acyltransferase PlsY [Armatimonadota bacterium]
MFPIWQLFWLLVCYVLGSIPTGLLVAQRLKGIDLSRHGSGNTGAANAVRALGWSGGALVLALDMLKGVVAVGLAYLGGLMLPALILPVIKVVYGMAAIIGHNYSIFRGFRGGKGIATSFGVVLALSPRVAILAVLLWIAVVGLTRYSSVGSLAAAASLPILMIVYRESVVYILFGFAAAALAFYRHKDNIERLREGKELRIDDKILGGGSST